MHPAIEARLGVLTAGGSPPPVQDPPHPPSETTATLNRLLRHELAAVEAYERADGLFSSTALRAELRTVQEGHCQRFDTLHILLVGRHAQPVSGPGVWGVVVRVAENTASLLGMRMVVATLHELEQRGVSDYRREVAHLDDLTRAQIERDLVPAQEHALATITRLATHRPEDAA
ncbi:MAG TPA: ferritin-like domain-containing protein [Planctomycetota bacterium]|nr:ferritin-like domain-containing protein [Planctomycetota bacterium]